MPAPGCSTSSRSLARQRALLPYAEADPDFLAIPVLQRAVLDLVGLFGDADGQDATTAWGEPPEEIGGYCIVRILGYGGMAVVYEARQQNPERSVALKLLCPGPGTPALKRRFNVESQLLGRLRHPGIAQIFEAGLQELTDPRGGVYHLPFLVMELVSGFASTATPPAPTSRSRTACGVSPRSVTPSTTPTARGSSTGT